MRHDLVDDGEVVAVIVVEFDVCAEGEPDVRDTASGGDIEAVR